MSKKKPASVPDHILKDMEESVRGKFNAKEPRLSDIAQHFFSLAGGAKGVATLLWKQILDPRTPAFVRARIVDLIMKAMKFHEDKNPPVEDTGLLTDDELQAEIDKQFEKMVSEAASAEYPQETVGSAQG